MYKHVPPEGVLNDVQNAMPFPDALKKHPTQHDNFVEIIKDHDSSRSLKHQFQENENVESNSSSNNDPSALMPILRTGMSRSPRYGQQYKKYTLSELQAALHDVQKGMPFHDASKKYNIPYSSLRTKFMEVMKNGPTKQQHESSEYDNPESSGVSLPRVDQSKNPRHYKNYSMSDLQSAMIDVQRGMSLFDASMRYSVPYSTLYQKIQLARMGKSRSVEHQDQEGEHFASSMTSFNNGPTMGHLPPPTYDMSEASQCQFPFNQGGGDVENLSRMRHRNEFEAGQKVTNPGVEGIYDMLKVVIKQEAVDLNQD